jgi:hypothetical protein
LDYLTKAEFVPSPRVIKRDRQQRDAILILLDVGHAHYDRIEPGDSVGPIHAARQVTGLVAGLRPGGSRSTDQGGSSWATAKILTSSNSRSSGHWRAIRPGDQGSATGSSGQSNRQVSPSGGVVLSDSQADGSVCLVSRGRSCRSFLTGTVAGIAVLTDQFNVAVLVPSLARMPRKLSTTAMR